MRILTLLTGTLAWATATLAEVIPNLDWEVELRFYNDETCSPNNFTGWLDLSPRGPTKWHKTGWFECTDLKPSDDRMGADTKNLEFSLRDDLPKLEICKIGVWKRTQSCPRIPKRRTRERLSS